MSTKQRQASSGSDGSAEIDEKKNKRKLSNRESARRSRMRKQKQMEDLANEASRLQIEIDRIRQFVDARTKAFVHVDSENKVLEAQKMELADRFESLNSLAGYAQGGNGQTFESDLPEMPDPLLKPWQLPYPTQPIMASADMFFG